MRYDYDEKVPISKDIAPITNDYHCDGRCKNLCRYDHPYYYHTAWCSYLGEELSWNDFWCAACLLTKKENKNEFK